MQIFCRAYMKNPQPRDSRERGHLVSSMWKVNTSKKKREFKKMPVAERLKLEPEHQVKCPGSGTSRAAPE